MTAAIRRHSPATGQANVRLQGGRLEIGPEAPAADRGLARHTKVASEPYQRRKGRNCADVMRGPRAPFPLNGQPRATPMTRKVIATAKIGASNQRAWPTLFSIASSRKRAANN